MTPSQRLVTWYTAAGIAFVGVVLGGLWSPAPWAGFLGCLVCVSLSVAWTRYRCGISLSDAIRTHGLGAIRSGLLANGVPPMTASVLTAGVAALLVVAGVLLNLVTGGRAWHAS